MSVILGKKPSSQQQYPEISHERLPTKQGRLITSAGTLLIPFGITVLQIQLANITELIALDSAEIVTLTMERCNLTSVRPDAFNRAKNLKQLTLSSNFLQTIQFNLTDSNISKLVLSDNQLTSIPELNALHSLQYLFLTRNFISQINGQSLLLPTLDYVDLSYNQLKTIRRSDLSDGINILQLDGNPWLCDCNLRDFVEFQRSTKIAMSSDCNEPEFLRGRSWNSLKRTDFACGPFISGPFINDLTVIEGESLTLSCNATGDPVPSLQFRRGTSDISMNSYEGVTITKSIDGNSAIGVLEIEELLRSDTDTYWCIAKCGLNASSRRFDVDVQPISIRQLPTSNSSSKKPEPKTLQSYSVLLLLGIIIVVIVVLSFCCFMLTMLYKRQKTSETSMERRRLSDSTDKDAELTSKNHLLIDTMDSAALMPKSCYFDNDATDTLNDADTVLHSAPLCATVKDVNGDVNSTSDDRSDLCPRKAPLAQYDRDTYVFPIVQTSL
uniref:Ig-like domain-containing protein n=1 Tax=Syphacia muris TaxID=451379 RepID=A0A0N5AGS1_9BILA